MTRHRSDPRGGERGQTLALFAIFLVVLLGATGFVIDVGGAWSQERTQQKAADVAALAGATAEANNASRADIIAAALASAQKNGYAASEVQVNIPPVDGAYAPGGSQSGVLSTNDCSTPAEYPCWVQVKINRAHGNSFAAVLGQTSWNVGASAVAVGGIANTVTSGAAPIQFNYKAVEPSNNPGTEKGYCDPQGGPHCAPNTSFPVATLQFAWTTFCVDHPNNCNVDSATAKAIINGGGFQIQITQNMYLGPNNHGQMSDVCMALVAEYPNGGDLPVAVSDDNGNLLGWWIWHFDPTQTTCTGQITIAGYFVSDQTDTLPLTISAGGGSTTFGIPVVRLVE